MNLVKDLGVFLIGLFRDFHFALQKITNPQSRQFAVQETCTDLCETVNVWTTVRFRTIFFPEM